MYFRVVANFNLLFFSFLFFFFFFLAFSAFSLQVLMKDGIASTLEKTFVGIGYMPHLKLKSLLECLKYFTASST